MLQHFRRSWSDNPKTRLRLNQDSPQADGLVAWWTPTDSRGPSLINRAHPGHDMTFPTGTPSPTYQNHRFGRSVNFLSQQAEYLTTDASLFDLGLSTQFTVSIWFQYNAVGRSHYIISDFNAASGVGFFVQITDSITAPTSNIDIYIVNSETAGEYHWIDVPAHAAQKTLYHMVLSLNGSTISIYLNGKPIHSLSQNYGVGDSPSPLRLGARGDLLQPGGGPGVMDGNIFDVRLYNRGLSEFEVVSLYDNRWDLYGEPRLRFVRAPILAQPVTVTLPSAVSITETPIVPIAAGGGSSFPGIDTISVVDQDPVVNIGNRVLSTFTQLQTTEPVPSVPTGTYNPVTTQAFTLTDADPAVAGGDSVILPTQRVLSIQRFVPVTRSGGALTPDTAGVTLNAVMGSVFAGRFVGPPVVSALLDGYSPILGLSARISPSRRMLTTTFLVPGKASGSASFPAADVMSATSVVPVVGGGDVASVPASALSVADFIQAVSSGGSSLPNSVTLNADSMMPAANTSVSLRPNFTAVSVSRFAPLIVQSGVIATSTASIVYSGSAPAPSVGRFIVIPVASASLVSGMPIVQSGVLITIGTRQIDLAELLPQAGSGRFVMVPLAQEVLNRFSPTASSGGSIAVSEQNLSLDEFVNTTVSGGSILPVSIALDLAELSPGTHSGSTIPLSLHALELVENAVRTGGGDSVLMPENVITLTMISPTLTATPTIIRAVHFFGEMQG